MKTNICNEVATKLSRTSGVYVVYHWDADGAASAALVLRHLGARIEGLDVPRIGIYSADAVPLPRSSAALLVLDYGLPGAEYEKLAQRHGGEVLVIDHHRVAPPHKKGIAYCNPVAAGLGGEEDYPANSVLVYWLLGLRDDPGDRVLAALGVAGDLAPYIDAGKPHPGLRTASELLVGTGVSLRELRGVAESIDSCYRLLDEDCLRYAAWRAAEDPLGLMYDERLVKARRRAERLLDEALGKAKLLEETEKVLVYFLEMDAYVTSAVGRKLAARNPDRVVVLVHSMPNHGRGTIYARSITHRLSGIADRLRARGVRVAGKTNVLVIEYNGVKYEELLRILLEAINITP